MAAEPSLLWCPPPTPRAPKRGGVKTTLELKTTSSDVALATQVKLISPLRRKTKIKSYFRAPAPRPVELALSRSRLGFHFQTTFAKHLYPAVLLQLFVCRSWFLSYRSRWS